MNEAEKVTSLNDLNKQGEIAFYEGKLFSGIGMEYFDNGQKELEIYFKNGKQEGPQTRWYENGQNEISYITKMDIYMVLSLIGMRAERKSQRVF